ncbi:MAG: HAD-IIA family hydrolase [Acidimicrobiia bacterium]|nr:HAD-IIA family hydrolase [Acidimicrobiia bacterium]
MAVTGTVVFDLDGVVYLGGDAVAGAGEALAAVAAQGFQILFCTNNSSRRRAATADKIRRISGFPARTEQVISSATAAGNLIAGRAEQALVVGGDGIVEALDDNSIQLAPNWRSADVVVVGVDFDFTYAKMADAMAAVRNGAWLVATNRDATYPTPQGLAPGAGSMVAAIEMASGGVAEAAGKPEAPMRALITSRLVDGPVWVVGDRPDTDVAMAVAEGWGSILALTGVTGDGRDVHPRPDHVVESIADVPALIASV